MDSCVWRKKIMVVVDMLAPAVEISDVMAPE